MNTIERVTVPKRILEFATRLNKECKNSVNAIEFTIGGAQVGENVLGSYLPQLSLIRIYVDKCLTHPKWMNSGVSYITGIWLNLLTAVAHEFAHVWQLEDEPNLMKYATLPLDYDQEAFDIALDIIDEYSEYLMPPKVENMGWVGQEIAATLNKLFLSHPDKVQELLEFNGAVIAGDARAIALLSGKYENENDAIVRLLQLIDEGREGKKVGNKKYLTFQDTVKIINSNHVGNGQQNLSYEETMSILKTHFMEV